VQRRGVQTVLILALALLPALAAFHSRSFFSPDETSYAQVAREMLETHDFVVPTIDGTPWLEKPPLVYWLLAGAFAIFGWGFPAAVLLNALLTAATALVIAVHVRRTSSPQAALLAAVAYLTMFLPLAAARSALTDPVLTLCTTAAIVLFLSDREGHPAMVGMMSPRMISQLPCICSRCSGDRRISSSQTAAWRWSPLRISCDGSASASRFPTNSGLTTGAWPETLDTMLKRC